MIDKIKSASTHEGCAGCRHQNTGKGQDWCYMFREAPEELPCGQHDKFAGERKATGQLVTEHPEIMAMIIGSLSN